MDKVTGMSGKAAARDAILSAFADIILESGYDKVRVLDVVARSGVARSTFYEHFQSREDLLRESMRGPFQTLAQLAAVECDIARVASTLDHIKQNRALAISLMSNPGVGALVDVLAELIEADARTRTRPVLARAIAGAQVAVLQSWLEGKEVPGADALAHVMRDVSRRICNASASAF